MSSTSVCRLHTVPHMGSLPEQQVSELAGFPDPERHERSLHRSNVLGRGGKERSDGGPSARKPDRWRHVLRKGQGAEDIREEPENFRSRRRVNCAQAAEAGFAIGSGAVESMPYSPHCQTGGLRRSTSQMA